VHDAAARDFGDFLTSANTPAPGMGLKQIEPGTVEITDWACVRPSSTFIVFPALIGCTVAKIWSRHSLAYGPATLPLGKGSQHRRRAIIDREGHFRTSFQPLPHKMAAVNLENQNESG